MTLGFLLFVLLFGIGFLIPFLTREPKVKIGEHNIFCNPKAKINLKKRYVLRLWDYNWPLGKANINYQTYMKKALVDFEKIYPNIKIELTLLDLLTGPVQLEEALKSNNAPDVYCSAYGVPAFNFKRQIPIGPFLKRKEKELYYPTFSNLLTKDGVLCYFPRWSTLGLWLGNRTLLEDAGFSIAAIQNNGWTWEELISKAQKIPAEKDLIVGNIGFNGLFTQLVLNSGSNFSTSEPPFSTQAVKETISFLEVLRKERLIPSDLEYNMISKFLSGQSLLLAGVRPSIYSFIRRKLAEKDPNFEPVFLPVPARLIEREVLTVENGAIGIYRNRKSAGDDHLAAAVRLGQYLSNYEKITPWVEVMAFPAAKNIAQNWLIKTKLVFYEKLIQRALTKDIQPIVGYQENIYPALKEFFDKKISGEELMLKIRNPY